VWVWRIGVIRGPKIKLTLERATQSADTGGAVTKTWTKVADIRGVLTFVWPDERVRADRENLELRYQFWCDFSKNYTPTTKDRFTKSSSAFHYKIIYVDNILEQDDAWKIDLVQTR